MGGVMAVGFLQDMRTGRRDAFGVGPEALLFWAVAGLLTGGVAGLYFFGATQATLVCLALATGSGIAIGLYAAFGASRLAKVLSFPGVIVSLFTS